MMPARLILAEFNEITPSLLRRFMAAGDLPNFSAFYDASTIYTTDAGDAPLEPWIQWPSIHCGVPYARHGVRYLGDGRELSDPGIAKLLSEAGFRVGVFGTINVNYEKLNGYYVPDAWHGGDLVHPQALRPFYDFVATHVRENTKGGGATPATTLRFLRFMLGHGLSSATVRAVAAQLLGERFNPGTAWKRATILDLLAYDVFRKLNSELDIEFASFFSNSTAHLQHYYWRNMDATGFHVGVSPQDDRSTSDAVRFGYRSMDALLGRMICDNPGARFMLCSGLSQQPWFETTKCTYRPRDFRALLQFAGVAGGDVRPVMAERFRIEFATRDEARQAAAALAALTCDGVPLMGVDAGPGTVYSGCDLFDADDTIYDRIVSAPDGSHERFGTLFYRITTMNSGRHHPDGVFWVRGGDHEIVDEPLPLTAIAPLVLRHFGIDPPESMRVREGPDPRQAPVNAARSQS